MDKYKKYLVTSETDSFGVIHMVYHFDNGFGASVVKGPGTYGYEDDLWELAMLHRYDNGNWNLYYCDIVYDDVLRYLNEYEVASVLETIMNYNERLN